MLMKHIQHMEEEMENIKTSVALVKMRVQESNNQSRSLHDNIPGGGEQEETIQDNHPAVIDIAEADGENNFNEEENNNNQATPTHAIIHLSQLSWYKNATNQLKSSIKRVTRNTKGKNWGRDCLELLLHFLPKSHLVTLKQLSLYPKLLCWWTQA